MIQKLKIVLYFLFVLLMLVMIRNIVFNFSDVILGKNLFLSPIHYPPTEVFSPSILEKTMAGISIVAMLSFCIGVLFVMKVLKTKTWIGYFAANSIRDLRMSGLYITISGVLSFVVAVIHPFLALQRMIFPSQKISFTLAILSIIIGVFFMLLNKVLMEARGLKLENDLTI